MFEDWIKEKITATDIQIEKAFQIDTATLKRWRLADIGPTFFRVKDTILYPRTLFIQWFEGHYKNKKGSVVQLDANRTRKDQDVK
tara:strand:+ start:73 stop:327 length:255 start_codon:yes stop_codon:yes gene_type:complete